MHIMAYIITVRKSRGRTDITGRNNSSITNNHTSTSTPVAGGPRADIICHTDKILIPRGPYVFSVLSSDFFHYLNILQKNKKNQYSSSPTFEFYFFYLFDFIYLLKEWLI